MNYSTYKNFLLIVLAFVAGSFLSITTTAVLAHGGDTSKLHACVDDTTGALRLVGENDTCPGGEHNVDWSQFSNNGLPFMCPSCDFGADNPEGLETKLVGKDLTNSYLLYARLYNANVSGSNFTNGSLLSADLQVANFSNTNLTGTNMLNVNARDTNFSNAIFNGTKLGLAHLENSNFTNATFTNANMLDASAADTANFTGAAWSNTICPDGTNSDDDGNTCVGHFTPTNQ